MLGTQSFPKASPIGRWRVHLLLFLAQLRFLDLITTVLGLRWETNPIYYSQGFRGLLINNFLVIPSVILLYVLVLVLLPRIYRYDKDGEDLRRWVQGPAEIFMDLVVLSFIAWSVYVVIWNNLQVIAG